MGVKWQGSAKDMILKGIAARKSDWLVCDENMEKSSMDFYYCQGLLLKGIVRMRATEVVRIQGVTRVLIGLIYLRRWAAGE
jgi:hypothetical protein